jgi:S-disulfanyl-L-cysteine oxidoreductase SoxD
MNNRLIAGAIVVVAGLAPSAQESRTVWSGVYTEAQSKRGEAVYLEMCANCHGVELEGMDMSPPLAGATFGSNWNDLTMGDLSERIRISMPADRPGTMTRAQVADVMAFMLKANKFPAGPTELPQDVLTLKQIRILPEKPAPAH